MKKILITLLVMNTTGAYATSMCVPDNRLSITLDPTINYTMGGMSAGLDNFKLWRMVYPYGTVVGTSALLSKNYGTNLAEIIDNGNVVVGGERNGNNCYCKMLHPLESKWIRINNCGASIIWQYCGGRDNGNGTIMRQYLDAIDQVVRFLLLYAGAPRPHLY